MQPDVNKPSISVWDYKPWWCQPWSILLTGVTLIGGSWLMLKTIWVTGLVAIPIGAWMGFFSADLSPIGGRKRTVANAR